MVDDIEGGESSTTPEVPLTPAMLDPRSPKAIAAGLAFSGLANIRNMEAQLRWVGFQAALGLNFLGWGGIAVWLFNSPTQGELSLMVAAGLGAIYANFLHFKIIGRDGKFMGLWNEKLTELETINEIEGGVEIFSSARYEQLRDRMPTIQYILRRSVAICGLVWLVFTVWAIGRILCFGG